MELIVIRHGESLNNVPGSTWMPDPDLSPRGIEQARALGERMAGVRIDALLASPLKRALRTANEISIRKGNMPVRILHELVEIGTDYRTICHAEARAFCPAALPYEDLPAGNYGDGYYLHIKDPWYMMSRGYRVISRIRQTFPEDAAVAIVAHVGFNQRLLAAALGIPCPPGLKFEQGNTCVNVIRYSLGEDGREQTRLVLLNDTSHLRWHG